MAETRRRVGVCGIVGVVGEFPFDLSSTALSQGIECISHRGPDEQVQAFFEPGCHLGMTRLAIRDLHSNLYPTSDCSGTVHSVFNGEIYNADQLVNEINTQGHITKSATDGEVIPHLIEAFGPSGLQRLKGMFAVAVWDSRQQRLILQRDRVGIKPLYYSTVNGGLLFASEIPALVRICGLLGGTSSVALRPDAVRNLTRAMFLPAWEETAFTGIRQVPPGHRLVWSQGSIRMEEVSELDESAADDPPKSQEEAVLRTRQALQDSVSRHLVADVPVSLALSGGVDSSLLAAVAVEQGAKLDAFTVTFTGDSRSEGPQADSFARLLGIRMHQVPINPVTVASNLDDFIPLYMDLSTLDGGLISTSLMAAAMRETGFRVGLFGEGADEVFGGYSWFGLGTGIYRALPKPARRRAWWYANTRSFSTPSEESPVSGYSESPLDWLVAQELRTQLPNHLLVKIDRGTMAHSLEGRVPYLYDDLLATVRSIPAKFRAPALRSGIVPDPRRTKPLLRAVGELYLGSHWSSTPKKGFMLPLDTLVRESHERVADLVGSSSSVTRAFLPSRAIRHIESPSSWSSMSVHMTWLMWRVLVVESVNARWRGVG